MTRILGTVRASSWPTLFDCSHRWYWQNVMGLRSPSGGRSALGTGIHAGTAKFDQARLDGQPISVLEAVDASIDALTNPEEEVRWDPNDLTRSDAETLAVKLTTGYCQKVAPQQTYVAIEIRCDTLDVATKHGIVRLTGTTDRLRQLEDGRRGAVDLKSGARATEEDERGRRRASTKGHFMQLGVYTLMAEQALQEPLDAPGQIVGLQTTKEAPVATGEVADVKTPLLGTDDYPGLIEIAAGMLASGTFPPNPKSVLCTKRYCPAYDRCRYHE